MSFHNALYVSLKENEEFFFFEDLLTCEVMPELKYVI